MWGAGLAKEVPNLGLKGKGHHRSTSSWSPLKMSLNLGVSSFGQQLHCCSLELRAPSSQRSQ